MTTELTERQLREIDYHKVHAQENAWKLSAPIGYEVLKAPRKRWWNAYWRMFARILEYGVQGKRVLVVGCGFGDDALRLAKLGARVDAFDLSPECLGIAEKLAEREGLEIRFHEMPSEKLTFPDASFDFILTRDILHHVDIPATMRELRRVAKPDAVLLVNEIYTHSFAEGIRRSAFVDKFLYPNMTRFIYGPGKPYITQDERKISDRDFRMIAGPAAKPEFIDYYNFLTTRVLPDRSDLLARFDQILLRLLRPLGPLLAGRVLFAIRIRPS